MKTQDDAAVLGRRVCAAEPESGLHRACAGGAATLVVGFDSSDRNTVTERCSQSDRGGPTQLYGQIERESGGWWR